MAAKKYYVVKIGKVPGIYLSWDECKQNTDGFPGAVFKGFATIQEAEEYLGDDLLPVKHQADDLIGSIGLTSAETKNGQNSEILSEITKCMPETEDMLVAYVDGSYEHSLLKYAFGCVFLTSDGVVRLQNGCGKDPETAKQRNVSGEMLGAMYAAGYAVKNGYTKLEIRFDYEGIAKWVLGDWKAKNELTQKYRDYMRNMMSKISVSFTKVAAHTNVTFNELADQMAKKGLTDKDGVPEICRKEDLEIWNP